MNIFDAMEEYARMEEQKRKRRQEAKEEGKKELLGCLWWLLGNLALFGIPVLCFMVGEKIPWLGMTMFGIYVVCLIVFIVAAVRQKSIKSVFQELGYIVTMIIVGVLGIIVILGILILLGQCTSCAGFSPDVDHVHFERY